MRAIAVNDYIGGTTNSMTILLSVTDPNRVVQAEAIQSQLASTRAAVAVQAQDAETRYDAAAAAALTSAAAATAADAAATAAQAQAVGQQAIAQKQSSDIAAALAQARLTQQQDLAVLTGLSGGFGGQALTPAQSSTMAQQAAAAAAQPVSPKSRTWTPAMGQSAAYRAMSQLLTPYSFAGGNTSGPTLGVDSAGGGENDGSVTGFDCSGLALYAWAPYLSLPHDAASQYTAAGRLHPTPDQLQPGDLIFWSSDATATGIHHVAIYLGAGLVVQAPQSGDVVRITAMNAVAPGIFGATRPLS